MIPKMGRIVFKEFRCESCTLELQVASGMKAVLKLGALNLMYDSCL